MTVGAPLELEATSPEEMSDWNGSAFLVTAIFLFSSFHLLLFISTRPTFSSRSIAFSSCDPKARDHIHRNGHGIATFRAHFTFPHHFGHQNTTFHAHFTFSHHFGHQNAPFHAHFTFSHHFGHRTATFRARFVLTNCYRVVTSPSAKRTRAHFTESVKRISGKSTCGEANDRLCLMTLGRRSRTKRKSCLSSRCERNE